MHALQGCARHPARAVINDGSERHRIRRRSSQDDSCAVPRAAHRRAPLGRGDTPHDPGMQPRRVHPPRDCILTAFATSGGWTHRPAAWAVACRSRFGCGRRLGGSRSRAAERTVDGCHDRRRAAAVIEQNPRPEASSPSTAAERTLAVTAIYCLSEQGRKLSLLSGGDGRAVQQLAVHVPPNRLHLVSVDADGVARLRLRPHYATTTSNRSSGSMPRRRTTRRRTWKRCFSRPPATTSSSGPMTRSGAPSARHGVTPIATVARRTRARVPKESRAAGRRPSGAHAETLLSVRERRSRPVRRSARRGPRARRAARSTSSVPRRSPRPGRARATAARRAVALHEEKKRVIAEWIATHGNAGSTGASRCRHAAHRGSDRGDHGRRCSRRCASGRAMNAAAPRSIKRISAALSGVRRRGRE